MSRGHTINFSSASAARTRQVTGRRRGGRRRGGRDSGLDTRWETSTRRDAARTPPLSATSSRVVQPPRRPGFNGLPGEQLLVGPGGRRGDLSASQTIRPPPRPDSAPRFAPSTALCVSGRWPLAALGPRTGRGRDGLHCHCQLDPARTPSPPPVTADS